MERNVPGSKRGENEREHLLSQLYATLDATVDGILVVGLDGKIEVFSKRFKKIWDIPDPLLESGDADRALSHVLKQVKEPDVFLKKIQDVFGEVDVNTFDAIHLKDGRVLESYSRPQKMAGKIIGRVWGFRDITERFRAEEALRESEERYRQLVRYAPAGLYEIDFTLRKFLTVNDVACEYSGYSRQELLEMDPMDLLTEESARAFSERLERILAGETVPPAVEYQFKKKDGGTIWVALNIRFTYEGDNLRGATVVAHDISERKKAEAMISNAKKQWEQTFDAISDWVSIIDADHTVVRSNKASDGMLHLPPKRIVGKQCYELVHGTSRPIADCPAVRAFKSKRHESSEFQLKDGRWVQVSVDPVNGNPHESVVHVVKDVTDIRKREQTAIAERKSEAFGVLAGGIAHDYNNLLSVIWGNISILQDDLKEASHQEILKEAADACVNAKELTHKFLTLSKGPLLQKTLCELKRILRDAIDAVPGTETIEVAIDISCRRTFLEADPQRLKAAFHNIVRNAVEAMPFGGKLQIRVDRASESFGSGNREAGFKITFKDSGRGIDAADLPKVFDPYFSTKGSGPQKGMGLGLAVTQAAVIRHRGKIDIESNTGRGTTVSIRLPAAASRSQTLLGQVRSLPAGKPVVLLMEDEPSLRKLCRRILERMGLGVLDAGNSPEAVALFDHAEVNGIAVELIVFDQTIEGSSGGAETLQELRRSGFDGKAVIVTGSPGSPLLTDFRTYGFDGRILKPYSKRNIESTVRSVLTG